MSSSWQLTDAIDFFEHVGDLARARLMEPDWGSRRLEDPREALELFLNTYAFERQGRDPSYPRAAVLALRDQHDRPLLDGRKLWRDFSERIKHGKSDAKLNPKANPLYHETGAGCGCIACFVVVKGDFHNIVIDSHASLKADQVRQRHRELETIRGVGPKIASFFLRDVALWYDISPAADPHLLQPIDIWVRRVVEHLSQNPDSPVGAMQQWIFDQFAEPMKGNHGMWYFGSQVAGSRVRLEEVLTGRRLAAELLRNHVESFAAVVEAERAWTADQRSSGKARPRKKARSSTF